MYIAGGQCAGDEDPSRQLECESNLEIFKKLLQGQFTVDLKTIPQSKLCVVELHICTHTIIVKDVNDKNFQQLTCRKLTTDR